MLTDLWERVKRLEGSWLKTPRRGRRFLVREVAHAGVTVVPRSTGEPRLIQWEEFQRAAKLGLERKDMFASGVREASEFNPSYVAAILRAVQHEARWTQE